MGKRRAHELMKDLGLPEFKDLVTIAKRANVVVKNSMQSLDEMDVQAILRIIEQMKRESVKETRVGNRVIRRRVLPGKGGAPAGDEELPEGALPEEEDAPAEPKAPARRTRKGAKAAEEEESAPLQETPVEAPVAEPPATPPSQPSEAGLEPEAVAVPAEMPPAAPEGVEAELLLGESEEDKPEAPKKKVRKVRQISTIVKRIELEQLQPAAAARPRPMRPEPRRAAAKPIEIVMPIVETPAGKRRAVRGPERGFAPVTEEDEDSARGRKGFRKRQVIDDTYLERRGRSGPRKLKREDSLPLAAQAGKPSKRVIKIATETIVVGELAKRMGIKASEVILKLLQMGLRIMVNQSIDQDTATLVASEFGYEVENVAFEEEHFLTTGGTDEPERLRDRAPVVTVMGHVDHGKTSILDYIRKTKVAASEAGGITQHIGAYTVRHAKGQITFLDTPGHEAFTAMRARGAQVTDVVILVVAADDGVMPQTLEAINHARAAKVPILVAVNKIDKDNANTARVRSELMQQGLVSEDLGGDTIIVEVSAKTGKGMDQLLELILLQAEVLELKANPEREPAEAIVVEGKLDRGRGPVGTVLVRSGTLKVGDYFVCGAQASKIKALINDLGARVEEAGPSTPVEVLGFGDVPEAGEMFNTLKDEKQAKLIADNRYRRKRENELAKTSRVSLEELVERVKVGEMKTLALVVKGDVQGTVEALRDSLVKASTEEVRIDIIHSGAGGITEGDVLFATASKAIIIGFNVRPEAKAQVLADREGVDIKLYSVIYDVLEDVRAAITGMMAPRIREEIMGHAEVLATFTIPKIGTIAGCQVTEGKILRSCRVRLLRDHVVVYTGKISSLRHYKNDVSEVASGTECGVGIEAHNDVKEGDELEFFMDIEEKPVLPPARNS